MLTGLFLTAVAPNVWAQEAAAPPTLGLVLSGGGAKGLAHIGVLKVLEQNGIYPDLVTGVSMGSIVGGLYAIGYTPDKLNELVGDINWNDYFSDVYPRELLPVEERFRADRYQLTFALEGGHLRLPRGLIQGRKIQTLLDALTVPVHGQENFDHFYRPFRCVATDLESGHAVVFGNGPLRQAIRASMSIPSAFEPVEVGECLLIDGMMARNLPTEDARAMGAQVVIAVDVGEPLFDRDQLTSVANVLSQTSSFGSVAVNDRQRALADVVIDPNLKGYNALSYSAADSLIARGEAAARAALPALRAQLARAGISWPMPAPVRPNLALDSFWVTRIDYRADQPAVSRTLQNLAALPLPATLTVQDLAELSGRLYGSGFFSLIDYELLPNADDPETYTLVLRAAPGPSWQVRGSLNYDTDYGAGILLNLSGRNVALRGSVLSTDLRISENPGLWVNYLVYTRTKPSIGFKLSGALQLYPGRIYADNRLLSEFQFHHYTTQAALFTGISRHWYAEGSLGLERLAQNRRFFSLDEGEAVLQQTTLGLHLRRDTYNRTYFPSRGSLTHIFVEYSLGGRIEERTGGGRTLDQKNNLSIQGQLYKVLPLRPRWWLDGYGATGLAQYQERNLLNLWYLGRDLPTVERHFDVFGLRYMEQPATAFVYAGLKIRTEVGSRNFVGLAYNLGAYVLSDGPLLNETTLRERLFSDGQFHGLGLELGALTTLGPVRFTTEYNLQLGRLNFSLYAGFRF